jgi:hypothetical protein
VFKVFDDVIEPEILTAKEIQETWERVWERVRCELSDHLCNNYDEIMAEFWRGNVVDEAPSFDIVEIPKPVIQPTIDTNTVQQVQDTVRRSFMNGSIGFDARAGEDVLNLDNLDNGNWLPVRGHRMTAAEEWMIDTPRYDFRGIAAILPSLSSELSDRYVSRYMAIPHECAVSAQDIASTLERISADARTSIQFRNGQTMLVVNRDETGAFDALANSLSRGGTLADFISEQKESEHNLDEFFDEFPVQSEVMES